MGRKVKSANVIGCSGSNGSALVVQFSSAFYIHRATCLDLSHTPLKCACACMKGRSSCLAIYVPCRSAKKNSCAKTFSIKFLSSSQHVTKFCFQQNRMTLLSSHLIFWKEVTELICWCQKKEARFFLSYDGSQVFWYCHAIVLHLM